MCKPLSGAGRPTTLSTLHIHTFFRLDCGMGVHGALCRVHHLQTGSSCIKSAFDAGQSRPISEHSTAWHRQCCSLFLPTELRAIASAQQLAASPHRQEESGRQPCSAHTNLGPARSAMRLRLPAGAPMGPLTSVALQCAPPRSRPTLLYNCKNTANLPQPEHNQQPNSNTQTGIS